MPTRPTSSRSSRADRERLHLFGIRHHGPGGAHSLLRALEALDPESVLIEGPEEANAILAHAAGSMRPPIAILSYAVSDPSLAQFYPFAEFSPEWQALRWALANERPVRFIDLPSGHRIAAAEMERKRLTEPLAAEAQDAEAKREDESAPGEVDAERENRLTAQEEGQVDEQDLPTESRLRSDPLSLLAEAAGHDDSEAWWSQLVEQQSHLPALFSAIEVAMGALREQEGEAPISLTELEAMDMAERWNSLREAHMRLEIRKELKGREGAIAVVSGAWHVPALRPTVSSAKADRALLQGLPKMKATVTWVPWTYSRLASASGYGAGITSPGWYAHLWSQLSRLDPDERLSARRLAINWMIRVASLLREHDLPASTAAVIEAARLAEGLAALRELAMPGLSEMRDAAESVLSSGERAPLALIEQELVIGAEVGEVGEETPQNPLLADLTRWQKRLRLKPEALEREISLDLRSETGLAKSVLLNRLQMIEVAWGRLFDAGSSRGTFREHWRLQWQPEFAVQLAEALVWGTTLASAASGRAIAEAKQSSAIGELSDWVRACLFADLAEAAARCIERLEQAAAQTNEVADMLEAVPPLVDLLRYGSARKIPEQALEVLLRRLMEQVCVGLIYACRHLDEEEAGTMAGRIEGFDHAVQRLESEARSRDWNRALLRLAEDEEASPQLQGLAVRRLYDQSLIDAESTAAHLSRALSPATAPRDASQWLEGFIAGKGQVLLLDEALRSIIDGWLCALDEEPFIELLPMLRRSFATLDAHERYRLLELLRTRPSATRVEIAPASAGEEAEAFAAAWPLLCQILALGDDEQREQQVPGH